MKYMALVLVLVFVSSTSVNAYGSSGPGHQRCTNLFVFTEPVTKLGRVHLTHPSEHEMKLQSQMNIIFDNGIEAAYKAIHEEGKSRSAPCPSSDKSWCDGWFY